MGWLQRVHRGENAIDFPKAWRRAIVVSIIIVVVGIVSLIVRGVNLSIEFEGGTLWEVKAPGVSVSQARDVLRPFGEGEAKVQIVNGDTLRIQSSLKNPTKATEIKNELAKLGTVDTVNSVGPTWGHEITRKAVRALVVFFILLSLYIWWRLEWRMAVGAMVAVVHDVLISVSVYSMLQLSVSPATVVSFLTILGYSLYDTVVVYDKVHELTARPAITNRYTYTDTMNLALNQVLTRSIATTLAGVLPVLTMLVVGSLALGASTLQEFSVALLVGLISGSYSSVFIAAPIVAWLKEREPRHRDVRARLETRGALAGGTTLLDAREIAAAIGSAGGGTRGRPGPAPIPARPAARKGDGGRKRAAPAPAGAARVREDNGEDADSGGIEPAAEVATATRPSSAIPPRPRKKKRR